MAFSFLDIALLENLTYFPDSPLGLATLDSFCKVYKEVNDNQNPTVGQYLNYLQTFLSHLDDNERFEAIVFGKTVKSITKAIQEKPELMKLEIADTNLDVDVAKKGGGGHSALFVDSQNKEAVFAFRGTAANEWVDNIAGATLTDQADKVSTQHQVNALEWYQNAYNKANLSRDYHVTVTGHSKGGNKAKYIAIMDDTVDQCISFDGQGFSDEFMEKYQNKIRDRQKIIENHNLNKDYVSVILNNVGSTTFYKGQNVPGFAANHASYSFFDLSDPANIKYEKDPRGRDKGVQGLHDLLHSYLRILDRNGDKSIKGKTVAVVSGIVKGVFDSLLDKKHQNPDPFRKLRDALTNPATKEYASDFLGFTLSYMDKVKDFLPALDHTLKLQKINLPLGVINVVQKIPAGLVSALDIPAAVVAKLKLSNLDLSLSESKKLVGILSAALEKRDEYNRSVGNVLDTIGGEPFKDEAGSILQDTDDKIYGDEEISKVKINSSDITIIQGITELSNQLKSAKSVTSDTYQYTSLIKRTEKLLKYVSETEDLSSDESRRTISDAIRFTNEMAQDYMLQTLKTEIKASDEKKIQAVEELRDFLADVSNYLEHKDIIDFKRSEKALKADDRQARLLREFAAMEIDTMTQMALYDNSKLDSPRDTTAIKDMINQYLPVIIKSDALKKSINTITADRRAFERMSTSEIKRNFHNAFFNKFNKEIKDKKLQVPDYRKEIDEQADAEALEEKRAMLEYYKKPARNCYIDQQKKLGNILNNTRNLNEYFKADFMECLAAMIAAKKVEDDIIKNADSYSETTIQRLTSEAYISEHAQQILNDPALQVLADDFINEGIGTISKIAIGAEQIYDKNAVPMEGASQTSDKAIKKISDLYGIYSRQRDFRPQQAHNEDEKAVEASEHTVQFQM